MEAQVKWVEGFKFLGQSNSGHSIVMDGNGGATAPSPMEMVMMAAGGCSSVDVVAGLKDAEQGEEFLSRWGEKIKVSQDMFLQAGVKVHWLPRSELQSVITIDQE